MDNLVGQTLGQYRIENKLAEGGAAVIYRAYQPSMERYVAIKVLKPELTQDPSFLKRFSQEARTVAQLQHPHILPVIDFGRSRQHVYLVMVLMEGGTLSDRLQESGPIPLSRCARLLTQVASALERAHSRGIVHRDLKPANILLDEDGNAYLTDFGIARILEGAAQLTGTGLLIGTPHYISPEQAMGRPADARSDIYALGVTLYEMVVGRVPFDSDTPFGLIFMHINDPPPPPKSIDPALPDAIQRVILTALAKNPDHRFQTALELAEAFAEALPKAPSISAQEEEIAAQQPLGTVYTLEGMEASTFIAPPTPTDKRLAPARMEGPNKITITNFAGDERENIPCTNGFMHYALRALEEIAGLQATEIILRFAGLESMLDHYPPNNLKLDGGTTWKQYSDLNHAIVNYYGASGKEAAMHVGRVSARWIIRDQPLFGFASLAFRMMPAAAAWRLAFNRTADIFRKLYAEVGVEIHTEVLERGNFFLFAMRECPCCVGKRANAPICWMWEGYMIEGGALVKGKIFPVEEIACRAMGNPYCVWKVAKKPVD